jgi:hypothetical protein
MKEEERALIELIKRVAKEVCREEIDIALDEHLTDYQHKRKPVFLTIEERSSEA